jgi:eukaryotic-like serine/threonine-protein kinase
MGVGESWRELLTQALHVERKNRPASVASWWQTFTRTVAAPTKLPATVRQAPINRVNHLPPPNPPSLLHISSFETVTLDERGQIINREQRQARYFTEELGNGVLLEMVEIPAGEFIMGSPENELQRDSDEGPQRQVSIPRFFIGRFTVTQAQWQQVIGNNFSRLKGGNLPVENISWNDTQEFCKRLSQQTGRSYRLPSEAEWEYACRAGTTTPFHFGSTITPELVNYDGNCSYGSAPKGLYRQRTTPVGSFPANGFGLHDMHGNVWEWCEDVWHSGYQGAPIDSNPWVSGGDQAIRLLRGGSRNNSSWYCRSAFRFRVAMVTRYHLYGFRLAFSAPGL